MIPILKSSFWNLFGTGFIVLSGAILTIVAPKFLSIQDFGLWRMFILYSTYAGVLHLGIADGYLLNNVSLSREESFKNLKRSVPFLLLQQISVSLLIFFILFVFVKSDQLIIIGASVLLFSISINIRTQLDNFLIIHKSFKISNIIKVVDKAIFLIFLFALLLFTKVTYREIIFFFILSSVIALFILYIVVKPKIDFSKGLFHKNIKDMKVGSQLLFSNIFIILLFNIDSIFVNMFLGIKSFAIFSFAITIIMLINQFAESISQVFFPYLATDLREKLFDVNQVISKSMFALWILILQFSYLFLPLIKLVFPNYKSSELIIVIYLITSLFTLLIRISQNNMFKVLNKQIVFVKIEVLVVVLVVLFIVFAHQNINLLTISVIILITRLIWYLMNEIYLKTSVKFLWMIVIGFLLYSGIYLAIYFYIQTTYLKFLIFLPITLPIYIIFIVKFQRKRKMNA